MLSSETTKRLDLIARKCLDKRSRFDNKPTGINVDAAESFDSVASVVIAPALRELIDELQRRGCQLSAALRRESSLGSRRLSLFVARNDELLALDVAFRSPIICFVHVPKELSLVIAKPGSAGDTRIKSLPLAVVTCEHVQASIIDCLEDVLPL